MFKINTSNNKRNCRTCHRPEFFNTLARVCVWLFIMCMRVCGKPHGYVIRSDWGHINEMNGTTKMNLSVFILLFWPRHSSCNFDGQLIWKLINQIWNCCTANVRVCERIESMKYLNHSGNLQFCQKAVNLDHKHNIPEGTHKHTHAYTDTHGWQSTHTWLS